jgi:hypothetical protein
MSHAIAKYSSIVLQLSFHKHPKMWFKVISVCFLVSFASASLICDGSSINTDGFVARPQKNKAAFGEFPWVVALFKKDIVNPHCVGSIIDEQTVVTTAFCVKK